MISAQEIEVLLGRPERHWTADPRFDLGDGDVVMVTGAAGSIGRLLVDRLIADGRATVIAFDRNENALFHLGSTFAARRLGARAEVVVGDVNDRDRLRAVCARYRPDIVFHAAAHKHVVLMESNPTEAVRNNLLGTVCVADVAQQAGVRVFVSVSTDKAVAPVGIMGASKRGAEFALAARSGDTRWVSVRLPNVLWSEGSVGLLFRAQLRQRRPLTITDEAARRYFVSPAESVQSLLAALHPDAHGVLVVDAGSPVAIIEFARRAHALWGRGEFETELVGLHAGEKLHEALWGRHEQPAPLGIDGVACIEVEAPRDVEAQVARLAAFVAAGDVVGLRDALQKLVPDYRPHRSDHAH